MIDPSLIQSAKTIRAEFLRLNSNLDAYLKDVKDLTTYLEKKVDELKNYQEEMKLMKNPTKSDLDSTTKYLLNQLQEIENQEEKLNEKVKQVATKIEKLQKEETELYNLIKRRYPELTDSQIISEIHQHLPK